MNRDDRMHELLYSNEGRVEQCERICRLEDLVSELLPYAGDPCPDECRYREECNGEDNRGYHGLPLACVAYTRLVDRAALLGVERA